MHDISHSLLDRKMNWCHVLKTWSFDLTPLTRSEEENWDISGEAAAFYLGNSDSGGGTDGPMAACTLSRRYYLMQLLLHILSWWGAKQHHFPPRVSQRSVTDWAKSWDYKITAKRDVGRGLVLVTRLTTSGLSTQVSPSEVHGDKSHGKLDSQTQMRGYWLTMVAVPSPNVSLNTVVYTWHMIHHWQSKCHCWASCYWDHCKAASACVGTSFLLQK